MENEEKLKSLKIMEQVKDCFGYENIYRALMHISEVKTIIKDLEIAQIFKNRMRILERDNYKVIKVDIFSDVPGFVEEYNKIIDWYGDSNE